MAEVQDICVGRRVFYPGNMAVASTEGTVVRIAGEVGDTAPQSIGGMIMVSSPAHSAQIRVVFDDGTASTVSPLHFHGARPWQVLDEVVDAARVYEAVENHLQHLRDKDSEARDEAVKLEAEKKRLLEDNPALIRASDRNAVQKNLRKLLKAEFPGRGFSVRKRRSGAVDVTLTSGQISDDEATRARSICGRFEGGHFDGMTDSYHYRSTAWTDLFGSERFVFFNR